MFWTNDLLMAKSGSLGTVWLISTLGPRNKRIKRKDLAKVEITRTCELIAAPPEPLALRLSGQLLAGVARVFAQNHENFYTDLQDFDSTLRRSIAADFGAMGTLASNGEIDLPGDGCARLDQITFADYVPGVADISWSDYDFARWPSSSASEDANEEMQKEPDKSRASRPKAFAHSQTPTYPPVEPAVEDVPDAFEPMILDIDLMDPMPSDSSFSGRPLSPAPHANGGDIDMSLAHPLSPGKFHPSPIDNHQQKPVSSQEASDSGTQSPPAPDLKTKSKSSKTRQTKQAKVVLDQLLELDLDLDMTETAYEAAMAEQRKELNVKARVKATSKFAERLLGGLNVYFNYLDPDMGSMVDNLCKTSQFKWQLDKKATPAPQLDHENPVGNHENIGPHASSDEHSMYPQPAFGAYPIDLHEVPDLPEVPRHNFDWVAESDFSDLPGPLDSHQTTPARLNTPRISDMSPLERSIRKHHRHSSMTRDVTGRDFTNCSRSGSVLSISHAGLDRIQLVPDEDLDELPDDYRFPPGHPFAPKMLATLEPQCRYFFSHVDKTMIKTGTDELELRDLVPRGQKKRVAAAAFHNCLTLATKGLLQVTQATANGPITMRIPPA
ncbi:hypothetical protein CC85DRAFT_302217 [Cutaneotrichosporon oleaginosum]|uniref:Rad21/Rec8-like protein N-terminal domain-containing protein n=1 Tax=Cutaneotrichosporon oleaginosum TaxID=879819 RepID=A0A0J0XN36_9TREE|nr:uncharacterized protein CC85DRAFT_302217 [Cutaneotrichosporon oleaginosum]KLT42526.1 hypothetical protein CC85DRAFT_302217 [Cutaneotrichosporon oleaginosum]TXT07798.1 hypothetical protein COLE_04722 [Cutaneotrichosporon oleaginosum]